MAETLLARVRVVTGQWIGEEPLQLPVVLRYTISRLSHCETWDHVANDAEQHLVELPRHVVKLVVKHIEVEVVLGVNGLVGIRTERHAHEGLHKECLVRV